MKFEDLSIGEHIDIPESIEGEESIVDIPRLIGGEPTFIALKDALKLACEDAPDDCDIFIRAFNIFVKEVRFCEPHTFLFCGFDSEGNNSFVIAHFSQLVACVVYVPKKGKERVLTGFSRYTKTNTEQD